MSDLVTHVDTNTFEQEVLQASGTVLVDFWAPWCMPCRMLAPVLEEVATQLEGKVKIVKLNVDEAPALADKYGVRGIPTMVVFSGGKEVDRMVGFAPAPALAERLTAHAATV